MIKRLKVDPKYKELARVMDMALEQAQGGKGAERHSQGEPFHEQPICAIQHMVGSGFALGQAIKKLDEIKKLPTTEAKVKEALGAMNYIGGYVIVALGLDKLGGK